MPPTSRNFTVDIPADANGDPIDGPCEEEPDQSCTDPADVDEDGHGTHVASTIASPINGLGIGGVAPQATIVNLRAGQDSGYFFLQPSVDALTYAGRHGIDVVNMSYYVDPWLFNCANHPADTPEEQAEQTDHRHRDAAGAERRPRPRRDARVRRRQRRHRLHQGHLRRLEPRLRQRSRRGARRSATCSTRPSCISMPSEGQHVISVSSTGPSLRKAYYSDYGNGYIDVAAPGGDAYDTPTGDRDLQPDVLAAYPESLAIANGEIDANGDPTVPYVVRTATPRAPAPTTSTCRAPRWPRPTPPAWPP